MTTLRIGVVGVGHMGQKHAEKTLALRESGADVELVNCLTQGVDTGVTGE